MKIYDDFIRLQKNTRKWPRIAIYSIFFLSFLFRNLYVNVDAIMNFPKHFNSYFESIQIEAAYTDGTIIAMAVITTFFALVFSVLIYEFMFRFYYELVSRKVSGFMEREDFVNGARLLTININILIGIFSISYFWVPELRTFGNYVVEYVIFFLLIVAYYKYVLRTYVGKNFRAKHIIYLATPFLLFNMVLILIDLVGMIVGGVYEWNFFSVTVATIAETVAFLLSILLMFIVYKKQKKAEELLPPDDPFGTGPMEEEPFREF